MGIRSRKMVLFSYSTAKWVQCKKKTKHILGWLQLLVFVAQQQETNLKYQSNWLDSSLFLFEGNLELFSELKCTRITTLF